MIKTRHKHEREKYFEYNIPFNIAKDCVLLDRTVREKIIVIQGREFHKCWRFPTLSTYVVCDKKNLYILKEVSKKIGSKIKLLYDLLENKYNNDFISKPIFVEKDTKNDIFIYPYNGKSLEDHLDKSSNDFQPIEFIKCLQIFNNILNGVKYFHRNKIAHCDLKSANISYDSKHDLVQIIDHDNIHKEGTERNSLVFSKNFEAPEIVQILSSKINKDKRKYFLELDLYKVDIWALGVIWYNLVTCKIPYQNEFIKINDIYVVRLDENFVDLINNKKVDITHLKHLTEYEKKIFLEIFLNLCKRNPKDRLNIDEAIEKLKGLVDIYLTAF